MAKLKRSGVPLQELTKEIRHYERRPECRHHGALDSVDPEAEATLPQAHEDVTHS